MMMRMVMKMALWLLCLGLAVPYTAVAAAGPGSCVGRCGEAFIRGQQCTCDFGCLQHNECCPDFHATCTAAQSCQGRCGEAFRRGLLCECDPQCIKYNTCCPDYQLHCDASVSVSHTRTSQPLRAAASGKRKLGRSWKKSNSESEEWYTVKALCSQYPGGHCPGAMGLKPLTASPSGPALPAVVPTNLLQHGVGNIPVGRLPVSIPSAHSEVPASPAPGSSLPRYSAPSLDGSALVSAGDGAVNGNVHLLLSHEGVASSGPSQVVPAAALSGPAGSRPRPSTLQDVAQALGLPVVEGGSERPGTGLLADVNLCSDSPINGLTALSNGTILIFKGELFWAVDPVSHLVGRPQSITDTLGVPSPIDTVFTRCNCHGHTYIIKGDQYWRLDGNMVMEPGYPKPLAAEFPGLTGSIRAALAVPATTSRPETVYFFKPGDIMQTFTFPPGSTPSCSIKPRSSLNRRQAVLLSGEINIKLSLKGFPTPVTSALSMPSPLRSDPYEHYIFSGPLFFSIQILGDLPALAKPDPLAVLAPMPILSPAVMATNTANTAAQNANPPLPANSIRVWLRCP
ncbi:proteoglycan 4a [Epinephelus fuscoguttatus]|uniref:proteoglycan 4a n=1 Tax=Epinephelus fuscoguttatus TaxID=293821 RepID=UPI0020D0C63A|nr:proteoglycan 4a [Epinephelus fuscoguttatus]